MQYDVENVFFKFDEDCSGTLEAEELYAMFRKNGIMVKMAQIKTLFDIVEKRKTGKLDLAGFKSLVTDDQARKKFTQMIRQIRRVNEDLNVSQ